MWVSCGARQGNALQGGLYPCVRSPPSCFPWKSNPLGGSRVKPPILLASGYEASTIVWPPPTWRPWLPRHMALLEQT